MAKLSARGRYELARMERIREYDPAERKTYEAIREKREYVLMSDKHILKGVSCWWADGQYKRWPYTVLGSFDGTVAEFIKDWEMHGFTQVIK